MIGIVDSGINNLLSLQCSLAYLGADVRLCKEVDEFAECDRLILPGVGAFGALVRALNNSGMTAALHQSVIVEKKPILGICLGMQVMASSSSEHGHNAGLGWFDASVVALNPSQQFRVPHMGWNSVTTKKPHPIFAGIPEESDFYFVHSFHVQCRELGDVVGTTNHGDSFVSMIARDNIFATQFHPEKSQAAGLALLSNFVDWNP